MAALVLGRPRVHHALQAVIDDPDSSWANRSPTGLKGARIQPPTMPSPSSGQNTRGGRHGRATSDASARATQSDLESELVHTIVRLGQSLQMRTIAEGVEDARQVSALRAFDCEFGQGYHFSRPLPAAELGKPLAGLKASPRQRKQPRIAAA